VRARFEALPLSQVAKALETEIGSKVAVPSALARSIVTVDIRNAPLQTLLLRLAPEAFVDSREQVGEPSRILAIRLEKAAAPMPKTTIAAGFVIEGNTEDLEGEPGGKERPTAREGAQPTPDPDAPVLELSRGDGGRLNLRARKQRLGALMNAVAQLYGVPFNIVATDSPEAPALELSGILPSELPGYLGPGVGIEVRRRASSGEETPLRFFVEPLR
jgi:hypothetical protein